MCVIWRCREIRLSHRWRWGQIWHWAVLFYVVYFWAASILEVKFSARCQEALLARSPRPVLRHNRSLGLSWQWAEFVDIVYFYHRQPAATFAARESMRTRTRDDANCRGDRVCEAVASATRPWLTDWKGFWHQGCANNYSTWIARMWSIWTLKTIRWRKIGNFFSLFFFIAMLF